MEQAVQFNRLYKDISESLESAQGDLSSLTLDNQEGKEKLSGIVAQLASIKNQLSIGGKDLITTKIINKERIALKLLVFICLLIKSNFFIPLYSILTK